MAKKTDKKSSKSVGTSRQYFIEDIFESFEEYKAYLVEALALFKQGQKVRNPTLEKYPPDRLDIDFSKTLKHPQLYFPRYTGLAVIILPDRNNLSPKQKAALRQRALIQYAPVAKTTELALGDEFAMRMKVMDYKIKRSSKRR